MEDPGNQATSAQPHRGQEEAPSLRDLPLGEAPQGTASATIAVSLSSSLYASLSISISPSPSLSVALSLLAALADQGKGKQGAFDDNNDDDDDEDSIVKLSDEQLKVVKMAVDGESLFITGGAGTGKSLVIREIIRRSHPAYHLSALLNSHAHPLFCDWARCRLPKDGTYITASTGIAACNVSGTTVHQFSGLGRGEGSADKIAKSIDRRDAGNRWRHAKTLVIDEISMVCGETFDKLNAIAKILRKNKTPFGGIRE